MKYNPSSGIAARDWRDEFMKQFPKISIEELSTILAALRYYQSKGLADDPDLRPDFIHAIATNVDDCISLNGEDIDALCEKINFAEVLSL